MATAVSGIPELVEDCRTGLLVEPESPAEIALAIERVADDPDRARRLSAAARKQVVDKFDIRKNAALLSGMIRRIVQPGSTPRTLS